MERGKSRGTNSEANELLNMDMFLIGLLLSSVILNYVLGPKNKDGDLLNKARDFIDFGKGAATFGGFILFVGLSFAAVRGYKSMIEAIRGISSGVQTITEIPNQIRELSAKIGQSVNDIKKNFGSEKYKGPKLARSKSKYKPIDDNNLDELSDIDKRIKKLTDNFKDTIDKDNKQTIKSEEENKTQKPTDKQTQKPMPPKLDDFFIVEGKDSIFSKPLNIDVTNNFEGSEEYEGGERIKKGKGGYVILDEEISKLSEGLEEFENMILEETPTSIIEGESEQFDDVEAVEKEIEEIKKIYNNLDIRIRSGGQYIHISPNFFASDLANILIINRRLEKLKRDMRKYKVNINLGISETTIINYTKMIYKKITEYIEILELFSDPMTLNNIMVYIKDYVNTKFLKDTRFESLRELVNSDNYISSFCGTIIDTLTLLKGILISNTSGFDADTQINQLNVMSRDFPESSEIRGLLSLRRVKGRGKNILDIVKDVVNDKDDKGKGPKEEDEE